MPAPDRGRLYGLLALRMGMIDRKLFNDLAGASVDTADPVGRELHALRQALSENEWRLLEQAVDNLLSRHGEDPSASAAALTTGPPGAAASATYLAQTLIVEGPRDGAASAAASPAAGFEERFHIVRAHAAGGLGEVYVAVDAELQREVALKQIRELFADDPGSRLRFVQEAQVTGRLEHPGIVPVYGMGRYPDGRPYYAMRFIGGESLKRAIQRFHEADHRPDRDGAERGLALRELLGRFLSVCDTLAYAHSRGVIHRDVKPANIMLGEFGETLVVDWGLARVLGATPVDASHSSPARPAIEGGSATQTLAGTAVGTPAYMSPEQAVGALERVGPVSDVYSLGAVLYELLTGTSAIAHKTPSAALQAVIAGEIRPPREMNPRVPPALEAVCLKAISRLPEDRYPSAIALADDIKAWLADEPVAAWREPWPARCGRWMRRRQSLVAGLAAATIVAIVSLSLGLAAQASANRRISQAHERTERTFANLRRTSDDFMDVVEQHLVRNAESSPEQQRLLQKGLAMYEDFLAEEPTDVAVREQLAAAQLRVSRIRYRLGQYEQAGDHAAAAVQGYSMLADETPDAPVYLRGWAESAVWQGEALRPHDPSAAEAAYLEAQSIGEQLRERFDDAAEDRALVARTHYNLGLLRHSLNRLDESGQSYRAAIELLTPLRDVPAPEGQIDNRQHLARSHIDLGILLREQQHPGEAVVQYETGILLYSELAALEDAPPEVHFERAVARMNLGNLYLTNRRLESMGPAPLERAEAAYRESILELQQLARRYPGVPVYRKELANSHNGLGSALLLSMRSDEAKQEWTTARGLFEALIDASPAVAEYHNLLGLTLGNLALQARADSPGEAIDLLSSAIDHGREALRINPDHPAYQRFLAGHFQGLIRNLIEQGDLDAAIARIDELLQTQQPDAALLISAAGWFSRCAGKTTQDEQRRVCVARALELLEQVVAGGYADRANLETSADFDVLREESAFQSLLNQLPGDESASGGAKRDN